MAQGKKSEVPTTHTGLRTPTDDVIKLKYIAKVTYVSFTDVVNSALSAAIAAYEAKKGPITEEQIKEVLKN